MASVLPWFFCTLCLFIGLRLLAGGLGGAVQGFPGLAKERASLRRVAAILQELEETLSAGLVPEARRWAALRGLPAPWGELAHESLRELRACGGAVLPTLRRLRQLAQEHDAALVEGRARSAQALSQALVCALLVPAFGTALYALLPGLEVRKEAWFAGCAFAVLWAVLGAAWMLAIADRARWAGLPNETRPWVLAAQCAGERFLALVRSGNPADLAWARACELLGREAAGLAARWGASIWGAEEDRDGVPCGRALGRPAVGGPAMLRTLEETGASLRKAVQVSLMEGRPCTERVETALLGLRQDLRMQIERELGLLGTRALKPLFFCVAPALFSLLGLGLWLSWDQAVGSKGWSI